MNEEQPIDLRLNRDQVRTIRGLVNAEMDRQNFRPAYLVGLLEILDSAETAGTIRNARLSALLDDLRAETAESRERAEIAKVYGPDLVDAVLAQRESTYQTLGDYSPERPL